MWEIHPYGIKGRLEPFRRAVWGIVLDADDIGTLGRPRSLVVGDIASQRGGRERLEVPPD